MYSLFIDLAMIVFFFYFIYLLLIYINFFGGNISREINQTEQQLQQNAMGLIISLFISFKKK